MATFLGFQDKGAYLYGQNKGITDRIKGYGQNKGNLKHKDIMIGKCMKCIAALCLIEIFALSSGASKRVGSANYGRADTDGELSVDMDSTQVEVTTWGIDSIGIQV